MAEEFDLSEDACDKIYELLLAKLANSNRMRVEDISTDVETHRTLRRAIIRTAYELGKTVAEACSKTPNDQAHRPAPAQGTT